MSRIIKDYGFNTKQQELFDQIITHPNVHFSISGPDTWVVASWLCEEEEDWCKCLDEIIFGIQVMNIGTKEDPSIMRITDSWEPDMMSLDEVANIIKQEQVLTDKQEIKQWIIDNGYYKN